jgi:hypothetical protein
MVPTSMPSKPTIDRSCGTRNPSARALRIVASARKSLEANIPVSVGFFCRNSKSKSLI